MKHLKDLNLFIQCDNKKQPYFKLDKTSSFEEADTWVEGAEVLIPAPYICLDFDNRWEFKKVCKILEAFNIKAPIMQSDRGGHVWFKTDTVYKNNRTQLPILLTADVKCHGKKSLAVLKINGRWRKWIQEVDAENVPDLPYWLTPAPKGKYSRLNVTTDFIENESRNNDFTKLVWAFYKQDDFSQAQVQTIVEIINDYLINKPLLPKELSVLTREASEQLEVKEESTHSDFYQNGHFQHSNVGQSLINDYHLKKYKGEIWGWDYDQRRYYKAEAFLKKTLNLWIINISNHQVNEVFRFIERQLFDLHHSTYSYHYIGLKNGLFNVKTFELEPISWDIFTPYYLDVYLPAELEELDVEIVAWFYNLLIEILSTQEQYELLMQYIGYALVPHNHATQTLFFYGTGANGKTLILEHLIKPLFNPYISSLPLNQLGARFNMASLDGTLVNIANENATTFVKNAETFKSVVSGDIQQLERKGKDNYFGVITTKLFYAFNSLPRFDDTSKGLNRRILFLDFKKVFEGPTDDPSIKVKIRNNWEVISSVLLYEAIDGLKELEKNSWHFPQLNKNLHTSMQALANPIIAWMEDQELTVNYFVSTLTDPNGKVTYRPCEHFVNECNSWCENNNLKTRYSKNAFTLKVKELFPQLDTKMYKWYDWTRRSTIGTRRYILKDVMK